jgi:hypothetical protein
MFPCNVNAVVLAIFREKHWPVKNGTRFVQIKQTMRNISEKVDHHIKNQDLDFNIDINIFRFDLRVIRVQYILQ